VWRSRRRPRSSSTRSAGSSSPFRTICGGGAIARSLLIGWTAALRRSELVALEVGDLGFEPEGVVLTIRRSKTNRKGAGATVAVPLGGEATCPVGALRRWLDTAAVSEGRVFRRIDRHGNLGPALSDRLAEIVAGRAGAAGLKGDFAGHSLRAGFATAAARAGRSEAAIMRHGRWKSVQIARRYIRQGARWDNNPAADLGL
jgi:integrase